MLTKISSCALFILLSASVAAGISNSTSSWCKDFDWRGETVKAVDDCNIFKSELSVKVSRLSNKGECINFHSLKVGEHERETKETAQGDVVTFTNTLSVAEANKPVLVIYTASLNDPIRQFKTSFTLDAKSCLSDKPRDGKITDDINILPYVSVIIITTILCFAVIATVYLVVRRRKEVNIAIIAISSCLKTGGDCP